MPRVSIKRGRKAKSRKTKTRGHKVLYLYLVDHRLFTRDELNECIDDGGISTGDDVYECTGMFSIKRGPCKLVKLPFKSD